MARPLLPHAMLADLRQCVAVAADLPAIRRWLWKAAHWHSFDDARADDHFEWVAQALESVARIDPAEVVRDFRQCCTERRYKGESFSCAIAPHDASSSRVDRETDAAARH